MMTNEAHAHSQPRPFENTKEARHTPRYASPIRLLVITATSVFVAEALIMLLLVILPPLPEPIVVFLDALLVTALVLPMLYFYMLRPMKLHIAERHRAEHALRTTNELLEKLFSITHVAVAYMDSQFNFIRVNRAYAEADESSPEFYVGKNHFDLFPHEENEVIFRNVVETGQPYFAFEKLFEYAGHPERGITYWDWSLLPTRAADGTVDGVVLSLIDVTSRKRMERALVENERRFRAIFNQTFQFTGLLRPDGTVLELNQPALDFVGCAHADVMGRPLGEVLWRNPSAEIRGRLEAAIDTAARGDFVRYEEDVLGANGNVITIDFSLKPVKDEREQVVLLIAEGRDISERKQAEEEIQRRNQELAALNAISVTVSSSLELPEMLATLKQLLDEALDVPGGAIFLYDEGNDRLSLEVTWGVPDEIAAAYKTVPATAFHSEHVIRENRAVRASDVGELPAYLTSRPDVVRPEWQGYLCVPFLTRGRLQGVLDLFTQTPGGFSAREASFFEAMGHQVGVAIQNARLYEAEHRARHTAETLRAASLALTQTLNLDTVLETLLDHLLQVVPYDSAYVVLLESESRLAVRAIRGYEPWSDSAGGISRRSPQRSGGDRRRPEPAREMTFDAQANPVLSALLAAQKSILIEDIRGHPGWEPPVTADHARSWLGVPLVAAGKVIGLYSLDKAEPGFFTREHLRLAEALTGQAAVAVQNAWLFEQVRTGRERLQTLSHRLVEVQEAERRYVARELHDETGQALTSLMFGLRLLEQESACPERVIARAAELKRTTDGISENLHRLAMDLRPASLDHLGLAAALLQYTRSIGDRYNLKAYFKTVGFDDDRLPLTLETALYRIGQEALTNVVRHAQATRVDVILERRESRVMIVVEDNGIGFDPEPMLSAHSGHLGLLGMRERVEMLGGTLVVESARGTGTTIVVEVPQ